MAINCLSGLTSYALGCRETVGVADLYVRPWSASTQYTYDSNGMITGGTSGTVYSLGMRIETAEYHPGVLQQTNSTVSYNETLAFELHQYQATLRNIAIAMAKAECEFFVRTQANRYFVIGEENGALAQENDNSLGKELNSMNGATFSFLAKSSTPAREVSAAAFAGLTIVG